MKKIAVFCASSMSAGVLVNKMRDAAREEGLRVEVEAYSIHELAEKTDDVNVAMICPQVDFRTAKVREICDPKRVPVKRIHPAAFQHGRGREVLEQALAIAE